MADRYWVGGGASTNWDATGNTNWSATSGGSNNASVPTTGDNVVFNGSSGAGTSVMNVALSLNSFDCNGFTGTLTHNALTLTITGNDAGSLNGVTFRLASGMTYTAASQSRIVTFTATSGTSTITTAGKTLGALVLNGAGGTFSLGDNLTTFVASAAGITLTAGTFTDNNHNVTIPCFLSTNSNTRVVTLGTGTAWTINAPTGTVWDFSTTTGLTINPGTATITFSSAATSSRVFVTGGKTFPNIAIADSGSTRGELTITSSGGTTTFASLALTAPTNVTFTSGQTTTISNAFTLTGTAFNSLNTLRASNSAQGVVATISIASGTPTLAYAYLQSMAFTGGATFTAPNSYNGGANTGITITGPSTSSGGAQIIGG